MRYPQGTLWRVLNAMPLPPAWATARQITERLQIYDHRTVKQILHELHQLGRLAKFGPVMQPAFRRIDIPEERVRPLNVPAIFGKDIGEAEQIYQDNLAEWKRR